MLHTRSRIRPHRQVLRPVYSPLRRLILLIPLLLTLTIIGLNWDAHAETGRASALPPPPDTQTSDTDAPGSPSAESGPDTATPDPETQPADTPPDSGIPENPEEPAAADPADPPQNSSVRHIRIWQQLSTDRPDTPESLRHYVITEERSVDPCDPLKDRLPDYPQFHLRQVCPITETEEHGTNIQNIYYDRDVMKIHFIIPADLSESGHTEEYAFTGLAGSPLTQAGASWNTAYSWVLGDGDPETRGMDETRVMQMTTFSGFSFHQGHPIFLEARPHAADPLLIRHVFLPPEGNIPTNRHTDCLKRNGFHTLLKVEKERCRGYEITGYRLYHRATGEPASSIRPVQFAGTRKVLSFPASCNAELYYRPVRYRLQLFTDDGTVYTQRYFRERLIPAVSDSRDQFRLQDYDWFLAPSFDKNSLIREDSCMPDHPATLFGKRKASVPEDPVVTPPGTETDPLPQPDTKPDQNPDPEPLPDPEPAPEKEQENDRQPEPEAPETPTDAEPLPETGDSTGSDRDSQLPEDTDLQPDLRPEPATDTKLPEIAESADALPDLPSPESNPEPAEENTDTLSVIRADSTCTYETAPGTGDNNGLMIWILSFCITMGLLIRFLIWPMRR